MRAPQDRRLRIDEIAKKYRPMLADMLSSYMEAE